MDLYNEIKNIIKKYGEKKTERWCWSYRRRERRGERVKIYYTNTRYSFEIPGLEIRMEEEFSSPTPSPQHRNLPCEPYLFDIEISGPQIQERRNTPVIEVEKEHTEGYELYPDGKLRLVWVEDVGEDCDNEEFHPDGNLCVKYTYEELLALAQKIKKMEKELEELVVFYRSREALRGK